MADGAASPVKGARPSIEIEGQRNATLTSALLSLDIVETADGLFRCVATFGNWGGEKGAGFQQFGRDTLEFGKALAVKHDDATLFDGRISAITGIFPEGGPPQIAVSVEDRLQDLRMTRRTRCFADASLADVLQRIASDHGLQPQIDLSGERHKVLAQLNQSDLAFVRDLARREDAQVWVEGTRLKAAQRARRDGGSVELKWAGPLRSFTVSADLAHQRTELVAAGWSVSDKQATRHAADEQAVRAEVGSGTSGSATLRRAFSARSDTLAHGSPSSSAEARALAEASFRHLARRFVVGHGVAETRPGLRVGAKLRIKGVGPLFEGDYVATDMRHRFDVALGLRSEFACDRPAIGSGQR